MKLCVALTLLAVAQAAGGGGNVDFDDTISKHFVSADEAKAKAAEANKPLVVFVTEPWCGACKNLKRQLNNGNNVKGKLDQFVVTHVSGDDAAAWKEDGHGYVPQTYFFGPDGNKLDIEGPNGQYAHFFGGEEPLAQAMDKALNLAGGAAKEL